MREIDCVSGRPRSGFRGQANSKGGGAQTTSLSPQRGGNPGADPSLGVTGSPWPPQVGDTKLLPRGSWSPAGVRHHQVGAGSGWHGRGWAWMAPLLCCLPLLSALHSRETYNSLAAWLTDARTLASPNIVVILCGNKKDLDPEREVTFLEASRFAQENGECCAVDQVMGGGMGPCTMAHEPLSFWWMVVPSAWRL